MNTCDQRKIDVETWISAFRTTLEKSLQCCPNCMHFEPVGEICWLARRNGVTDARPPANVIAFGCAKYEALPPF